MALGKIIVLQYLGFNYWKSGSSPSPAAVSSATAIVSLLLKDSKDVFH